MTGCAVSREPDELLGWVESFMSPEGETWAAVFGRFGVLAYYKTRAEAEARVAEEIALAQRNREELRRRLKCRI